MAKMSKRSFYYWYRCRAIIQEGKKRNRKVLFKTAKVFHKYLQGRDMYLGALVHDLMKRGYVQLANKDSQAALTSSIKAIDNKESKQF